MRPHTIALLVASSLALVGPEAAVATYAHSTTKTSQGTLLFVFDGPSSRMAPVNGQAGTYTLTIPLTSAKQSVTWFTDRPVRDAGLLPMNVFVGLWAQRGDNTFASDPPNIAIAYTAKGKNKTLIATMSVPVIRPKGPSRSTPTLQATIKVLPVATVKRLAKGKNHIAEHAARATREHILLARTRTPLIPAKTGYVRVFVDDYVTPTWEECMNQMTNPPYQESPECVAIAYYESD